MRYRLTLLIIILLIGSSFSARDSDEIQPPKAKKYEYKSLKDLSMNQLKFYMTQGKTYHDYKAQVNGNKAPKKFWVRSAAEVALELVRTNHKSQNKNDLKYHLKEEHLREGIPSLLNLSYRYESSSCYTSVKTNYHIHYELGNSYLISTRSVRSGVVFYNFIKSTPSIELRFERLDDKKVSHFFKVLHYLSKIQVDSEQSDFSSFSFSTADGRGNFSLTDARKEGIKYSGTIWSGYISERRKGDLSEESRLNFVDFLLTEVLEEVVEGQFSQSYRGENPAEESQQKKVISQIFELAQDDKALSPKILEDCLRLIEYYGAGEFRGELETLQQKFIANQSLINRNNEIEADIKAKKGDRIELYNEQKSLKSSQAYLQANFNRKCEMTLTKLNLLDKPDDLLKMAQNPKSDFQWALYQLQTYPGTYVKALEYWLTASKGKWLRQVYAEIKRVNPARAAEIAKHKKELFGKDLLVSLREVLDEKSGEEDPLQRKEELLDIVLDPKRNFSERSKAIELLVPKAEPLKYATRDLDEALLYFFEEHEHDKYQHYIIDNAAKALARRGRQEYFSTILKMMQNDKSSFNNGV